LTKATVLTDRFDRALLYAIHVHGGQVRKGTSTPYVAHLLAVAATVLEYGGDEDLAIAALLHDSVEDQGGKARLDDVRNRFGEGVARIVEACSDSLADTGKGERKAHWQERKEAYLAHLRTADEDILWVSLADKVHNARAILRDLRKPDIGEKVWSRFKVPKEQTLWYYRSLADRFCERLSNQLSNELHEIVELLDAEVAKAHSSGRLDAAPPAASERPCSSAWVNRFAAPGRLARGITRFASGQAMILFLATDYVIRRNFIGDAPVK
jgi:(p)ppGpp synthase/HD superfamily hydrolase